jgi:high-affinity Fe2+/Pb2+ permease
VNIRPPRLARAARLALVALFVAVVAAGSAGFVVGASPASAAVSRGDGIDALEDTRRSIDRTLDLIKAGREQEAFTEAANGYLTHFEKVEIPLRVVDNSLTIRAEGMFAEIRTMIRSNAPTAQIRDRIVELRNLLEDAERKLTAAGLGAPTLVIGQAFLILFREGFEVVLLMSVLVGYLESAKSMRYLRPILVGVGLAVAATALTVALMPALLGARCWKPSPHWWRWWCCST